MSPTRVRISSTATNIAGTSGNAVRVLQNALHIIVGFMSLNPAPKVKTIALTIDGKPKPLIEVGMQQRRLGFGNLQYVELNQAFILKQGTTFLAQIYVTANFGASVQDVLVPLGFSFVTEPIMRITTPSTIPGTSNNVVVST